MDSKEGLSVDEVSVRFGGLVALDRVSLEAAPGRVHGVIGPNGAGKTTLFNVMCGFVKPDSGTLTFFGQKVHGLRPEKLTRMGVARTLQGLGLFSRMPVLENVMIGADSVAKVGVLRALLGAGPTVSEERRLRAASLAALDRLGVAGYAGKFPPQLPYAIQKKVALARALVSNPRFLLLDEPASGLSEEEMGELGDLIVELASELGIVLVEHHMDLVMRVCSNITVLDFGRVIAEGNPAEVKANPLVTEAYLGDEVQA
ncbi:MAG: ABC transporter ATP-binding protein [Actinomycetota bacterium]|nr:ABC transporter ATP-binding protein [Actinomycetota bacterium]